MISLVLGLGNIGERYRGTRHNVGFEVLQRVVERTAAAAETGGEWYDCWRAGSSQENRPLWLARPLTLMNRSGLAARALLERLGLPPEQMLVVVDDFNLPLGALRLRKGGSDGGHRGLASIIEALGTDRFPRLRLGIGRPKEEAQAAEFVLGRFDPAEAPVVEEMCDTAAEAVLAAVSRPLDRVMSQYNRTPAPSADRPGGAETSEP